MEFNLVFLLNISLVEVRLTSQTPPHACTFHMYRTFHYFKVLSLILEMFVRAMHIFHLLRSIVLDMSNNLILHLKKSTFCSYITHFGKLQGWKH
jgi:hypothetical protein